nr:ribonuclease H-like domain-containing protein [Tanacetum cinerariifolium]
MRVETLLDSKFEKDVLYEDFSAPQWIDFSQDVPPVDDEAWFCRPDCNHPKTVEDFYRQRTPDSVKLQRSATVSEIPKYDVAKKQETGVLQDSKNERMPLLEVKKEKYEEIVKQNNVKEKLIKSKLNCDPKNTPTALNMKNIRSKDEERVLQIRTNPPSPQCFSANNGTTKATPPPKPFRLRPQERVIFQEIEGSSSKEAKKEVKAKVNTASETSISIRGTNVLDIQEVKCFIVLFLIIYKEKPPVLCHACQLGKHVRLLFTPVDIESKLGDVGDTVFDPTLYWSLAGFLQCLTFTRPDISYAIQQVFLHTHDPREPHFSAFKKNFEHQRTKHIEIGIHFVRDLVVVGQLTLSCSSAEAEYRGVTNVVAETCWLRNLLRELHTPLSSATLVYCDNVRAVYLSCNLKYVVEILERMHMVNCNPSQTLVDIESKLGDVGDTVFDPTLYWSLAGSLQCLTFTRSDISYAIQQVFLHTHDPREPYFSAFKKNFEHQRTKHIEIGIHFVRDLVVVGQRASKKKHLEATYVYGLFLFSRGDESSKQGLELLNGLKSSRPGN